MGMHGAKQRTMFSEPPRRSPMQRPVVGSDLVSREQARRATNEARSDTYVQEIISLLDLPGTPEFHRRLDKVRAFINDHSIHRTDRAFRENRKEGPFAVFWLMPKGCLVNPSTWNDTL